MSIELGRDICSNPILAREREWLIANGIGGYGSGTIAGILTRRYHGLLVAALKPPLERTLLLTKLEETVSCEERLYPLYANQWADGTIEADGLEQMESFHLEGSIPVWHFAIADALLEKRVWMEQGANTTYVRYKLLRSTQPISLSIKALVNYRNHHHLRRADRQPEVVPIARGVSIENSLYMFASGAEIELAQEWYYNFALAKEGYRGLDDCEDHFHAVTFCSELQLGESLTIVASTDPSPNLDGRKALKARQAYEQKLVELARKNKSKGKKQKSYRLSPKAPDWADSLVLAADQFIVNRYLASASVSDSSSDASAFDRFKIGKKKKSDSSRSGKSALEGKTIIAGYPWFSDWGRDTMISLPGLTLCTGRPQIARTILETFARYVDKGMLPNAFPEAGETPHYNTVDATLWYFEAIRAYYEATGDRKLVRKLWPILVDIIDWHERGTRYQIHMDPEDGLIYAGEPGVQLTWMDAKVGDWVVTPRTGKAVEINALWYNALQIMVEFAGLLRQSDYPTKALRERYRKMAERAKAGFARFWNADAGYCYDVIDIPIDSSINSTIDNSINSGIDSLIDSEIDSPIDSGIDSPIDSGIDSSINSGIDSPIDSGIDNSIDDSIDNGIDNSADNSAIQKPIDKPTNNGDRCDETLRPNQIFAVSLAHSPLTRKQQQGVVDACARKLLTSHGLRSLSPDHPKYQGHYGGEIIQRDGGYHQGTVWGWLLGPFVLAHLRVYQDPIQAQLFLEPMVRHLLAGGVGSLSEIFDGDAPMTPRGCIAQAWTVAELLRSTTYLKISR